VSDYTNKLTFISFSVGAGRWRQEGVGGREVCWCQIPSPGRRHPGVRRVARGQTLQDDPLPDPAGWAGGEGTE
jgi:hypothetical protein